MAETDCKCSTFSLVDGVLVCSSCKKPSTSKTWRANIYGKAVEQSEIENKGRIMPPESKRMQKALR